MVTVILNLRLGMAINFYDVLYGLRPRRGTGIASIEANMLQHLAPRYFPWYTNAYNALDRDMYLGIIAAYGMGPRAIHLLWRYW